MAQPEPMEKPSDTGAVDDDATSGEFHAKFVQRQFAILRQPLSNPRVMRRKLAAANMPCWRGTSEPVSHLRITRSFTKRGETRKCRAACYWP